MSGAQRESPLQPLPPNWQALLSRYRLRSRRMLRPAMVGGHLTRRKGASLEFRDFSAYTPGDDIRHVDWRATARLGRTDQWLIRRFQSEEQMTLTVSLDLRSTMGLPEAVPKSHLAAWLAEAIARIGMAEGDRVVLHGLFNQKTQVNMLRGGDHGAALAALRRISGGEYSETVNLKPLDGHLNPAGVWIIISDFYFDDTAMAALAERVMAARRGLCWVILVDLDSWPYERNLLGTGAREIEGPGLSASGQRNRYQIDGDALVKVEQSIRDHKQRFLDLCAGVSVDRTIWSWPKEQKPEAEPLFRRLFLDDPVIARLFMREAG